MENSLHCGIVLRSYVPYKNKLLLLDQQYGMIEVIFFQKSDALRITHGMLVRYTLHKQTRNYRCDDVAFIACPHKWVSDDIFFLHHVLELAAFFLSYNQIMQEVFQLFSLLYKPLVYDDIERFKKCFLCKFFVLIGICPDSYECFTPQFFRLISAPIDTMVNSQDDLLGHTQLARWLKGCIAVHPYGDRLKTTVFLTRMDTYES